MVTESLSQPPRTTSLPVMVVCFSVIGIHVVGYFVPSGLTWGFNFFAFLPSYVLIAYAALGIAVILFLRSELASAWFDRAAYYFEQYPWLVLLVVCGIFTGCAFVFQVQVPLLGDSFIIIKNYDNEFFGAKELWMFRSPMAVHYFSLIMQMFEWTQYPAMLSAFLVGEIVLGIGFILCLFLTVKNFFTDSKTQLTAFLFLTCMPYMQIFFGYVEVYAVLLFALALFFLAVALYRNRRLPFIIVAIAFIYMALAHMMTMFLAPMMLYLTFLEVRSKGVKVTLLTIAGILILCFALFAALGFDLGKIVNLAPYSNFLTILNAKAPYQAYALFSVYHLTELLNAFLLTAPLSLLLLVVSIGTKKQQLFQQPLTLMMFIAVIPLLLFIAVAKFDLGMAKDWDIVASLMFVVSLSSIVFVFLENSSIALKSVQMATVTMALTSLPWFYLNSTVEENIHRTESFQDTRVVSPEGYYLATIHLAAHYMNVKDMSNLTRVMETHISAFPNDFHIYRLLARTLIDHGDKKNPKIEELFLRWLNRSPQDTLAHQEYAAYIMELGTLYYKGGLLDSALIKFEQAISLDSNSFIAYNNVGLVYLQRRNVEKSLPNFHKAIALNPAYSLAYLNLAGVYAQTSKPDSAIMTLNHLIQIDEYNIAAYENLSKAYYQNGEKEKAVETLKIAARMGSATARYLLTMSGETWE